MTTKNKMLKEIEVGNCYCHERSGHRHSHKRSGQSAFTLMELMIVIGLLVLLTMLTIPYGMNFYRSRTVEEQSRTISHMLERARSHAVSGKEDSDWGVYFATEENCYTFFAGKRYEERDEVYDLETCIPGGASLDTDIVEVVFERHTGDPNIFKE